ncbi:thioredoxin family protein [Pseudogracilibacillus sp. SE30717A]|uniref:thioredoxin family protein n=1 Tax=Pseudogracilibacillus sp. SE30717A TaxID=3098293 RepID=UPI00300E535F
MDLNTWFERGITKEEYMSSLDKHRDSFMTIYNNFTIPDDDKSTLHSKENIRTLVLAEVWCGHCMLDIPILLNIVEEAGIPIRFLRRDENLEVMDRYLTNDKRYIPIVIFIDNEGNEIAKWGPMAPEVESYVSELKQDIPDKESPGYKEAFQKYVDEIGNKFTTDKEIWNYVYEDMKKTLL